MEPATPIGAFKAGNGTNFFRELLFVPLVAAVAPMAGMRVALALTGVVVLFVFGLLGLSVAASLGPPPSATVAARPPIGESSVGIPGGLEPVYRQAATAYCDGLPWEALAGIGWVESRHARGDADPATGEVTPRILGPAIDGRPGFAAIPDPSSPDGWAHAEGPMQFLPSTWRRWATLAPSRPPGATPSPHNAWDAIHAAARMLCGGRSRIVDLRRAIFGYNHDWGYVDAVLAKADEYAASSRVGT